MADVLVRGECGQDPIGPGWCLGVATLGVWGGGNSDAAQPHQALQFATAADPHLTATGLSHHRGERTAGLAAGAASAAQLEGSRIALAIPAQMAAMRASNAAMAGHEQT